MARKRDPLPRVRDAWSWLGGIALLGLMLAGVTGAAVVLWENVDIRRVAPELGGPPVVSDDPAIPPAPARQGRDFAAVILDSPRNREFFPNPDHYPSALDAWRGLLSDLGGRTRRISEVAELRDVAVDEVLVVPEAPCLSDEEIEAVRSHLEQGGALVANGPIGARDGACEWAGWGTVTALTGAEDAREIPGRSGMYLSIPSGLPLSPGLSPGVRIELRPEASMALRASGPNVYWSDQALNPAPDESGGGADVAAVGTVSPYGGRVAWFGFQLRQAATPGDSAMLARVVRNGIAWAAGLSVASVSAWPDGHRAAAMFVLDVESQPSNAVATASMLRAKGVPGTFYAVSRLVADDDALGRTLIGAGEVGTQTADHMPLGDLTARDQRSRLRRTATDIERWTGVPPLGLHPPEESHDSVTIDAWLRAGGTYLLATNSYRSASPELHHTEGGVGVLLPRMVKDDYNIIVQDRVLRWTGLRDAYLAGVRKVRAIGGLAVVAGHTQILRPGQRVDAVAAVADSMAAHGDWWIATGGDIADWWSARAATTVATEPPATAVADSTLVPTAPALGPGVTSARDVVSDIFVTAPPDRGVAGLWLDVVLPEMPENMIPLVNGEAVDFASTRWGMRVPLGTMVQGEIRRVTFVILGPDPAGTDPVG